MAASGKNRKWNKGDRRRNDKSENKTDEEEIEKSPVLKAFLQYRNELDAKHDKYERLVKLSRDITIESKRIIFLLLSNTRESADDSKLTEAKSRIMKLITTVFFNISKELEGEDYYQFTRSYCPGIQEFVEAYTFYYYLKCGKLLQWEDIQNDMIYKNKANVDDITPDDDDVKTSDLNDEVKQEVSVVSDSVTKVNTPDESENVNISDNKVDGDFKKVLLTPIDYVLGVEDLTGELMRYCINSLATDNINAVHRTCNFVRSIHSGLTFFNRIPSKEFYRKITVLRESLYKIENTCYMLRIRGTEVPKHMLADFISCQEGNDHFDEDEGFY